MSVLVQLMSQQDALRRIDKLTQVSPGATEEIAYHDAKEAVKIAKMKGLYLRVEQELRTLAKVERRQRKLREAEVAAIDLEDSDEDTGPPEDGDDDGDIPNIPKPKPKADKKSEWDPKNRKVNQDTPRLWVDDPSKDFDGCEDKDRKVGVVACFQNSTKTRRNKHLWCVCDRAPDGHWVSTQGNHSENAHPNALMPGFAISSRNKQ